MFLLDTNVLSELRLRARANPAVIGWARSLPSDTFFLSAITILEVEIGTLRLARRDVARAAVLRAWIDDQESSRASMAEFFQLTPRWRSAMHNFTFPISEPSGMRS